MRFSRVPIRILVIPILAIALFWLLSLDLMISRKDGVVLFCAFAASVIFLVKASGNGIDIKRSGGIEKDIEGAPNRWKSAKLLIFSLIVIVVGSEMLVKSSETIMENFGISDTVFGMTVLALMLSIEELARELPAAMRGRPEISFGNVIGSIISFFLFNAAIIAFIRPFELTKDVLSFYLPMTFITTTLLCAFMITRKISRLHGVILIILYAVFIIRSYS
jgi:cation:H+ antiporter